MKEKVLRNWHYLLILYFPVYLAAFQYIETHSSDKIHIIECALDHKIPFIEYFVIPYFLWFTYIGIGGFYFLFREKESFIKMMYIGMIGMTTFIVVSMLYPNGLDLRPTHFARENVFVDLTRYLYSIDTSTNVFPSIHVYNSIGMHAVISHSPRLKEHKGIQSLSFVLSVSIVLATMFLKQHSVFDVVCAMGLFLIAYEVVYGKLFVRIFSIWEELGYHRREKLKQH